MNKRKDNHNPEIELKIKLSNGINIYPGASNRVIWVSYKNDDIGQLITESALLDLYNKYKNKYDKLKKEEA